MIRKLIINISNMVPLKPWLDSLSKMIVIYNLTNFYDCSTSNHHKMQKESREKERIAIMGHLYSLYKHAISDL